MQKTKMNIGNQSINVSRALVVWFLALILTACISKEAQYSDQQKRMLRCDQYIGQSRDECLNGMTVTIEDYKQDWREFERDEAKREAEANKELEKNLKTEQTQNEKVNLSEESKQKQID
ncbi:hypothetical protein [Glaciecola petra]|uniref:Lipoprotein n=1 Tax=Glaciecola petra TaxID=3075602 RepID=A0ABU2ZMT8_9ALTE|nr:hypothetical protein [Aestuariibacter sp. P117]MDT0593942.1 hypothetical protein [Aestuariibacter sp. P117]